MREEWQIVEADARAVETLSREMALPESVARILVARGYADPALADRFLQKSMRDLLDPSSLAGIRSAVDRLCRAVHDREGLLVHGDFDADGLTATALLTLFFRELGIEVVPFIPDRLNEGHGISMRALPLAQKSGAKLMVTCDCGSSSAAEISAFAAAGVETIVTDHHALPEELPRGAILVNPKLGTQGDVHDDLAGVGVAFMLIVAVRTRLREEGFFQSRPEPNLRDFLDVVALGTLADMASLRGQNRILVSHGLDRMRDSRRAGIAAMRRTAGLEAAATIEADDVGFRLAPRLNAAARLGHANEALELLLTSDSPRAQILAERMEEWNLERRQIQEGILRTAEVLAIEQVESGAVAIVVGSDDYHVGVIGLVAQKLAESTRLPTFVFSFRGDVAKGSARSRSGVNLVRAMERCSDLLENFGGHQEAGGCTLRRDRLPEFSKRFQEAVREQGVTASRKVWIDAPLNLRHLNEGFLAFLDRLRPFGVGNPEPLFSARAKVYGEPREVGRNHLRVTLRDERGPTFSAIGFGMWSSLSRTFRGEVEVAYTPEQNEWKGRKEIQLRLRGARSV